MNRKLAEMGPVPILGLVLIFGPQDWSGPDHLPSLEPTHANNSAVAYFASISCGASCAQID